MATAKGAHPLQFTRDRGDPLQGAVKGIVDVKP
jgi:hypothetical protein